MLRSLAALRAMRALCVTYKPAPAQLEAAQLARAPAAAKSALRSLAAGPWARGFAGAAAPASQQAAGVAARSYAYDSAAAAAEAEGAAAEIGEVDFDGAAANSGGCCLAWVQRQCVQRARHPAAAGRPRSCRCPACTPRPPAALQCA